MRITESRLREIIRSVIVENLENQILDSEGNSYNLTHFSFLMEIVYGVDSETIIKKNVDEISRSLKKLKGGKLEEFRAHYGDVVKMYNENGVMTAYFDKGQAKFNEYLESGNPSYYDELSNLS